MPAGYVPLLGAVSSRYIEKEVTMAKQLVSGGPIHFPRYNGPEGQSTGKNYPLVFYFASEQEKEDVHQFFKQAGTVRPSVEKLLECMAAWEEQQNAVKGQ